jgi:hypothetical protein
MMSVATDDLGDFRLFWLPHGEYHISSGYSERERNVAAAGLRLSPNLSKPDDGLPTIYYPGEYTLVQSQKVRLTRDTDSAGTQIFLKDGPQYSLDLILVPEGACARVVVVAEGAFVTNADFTTNVCGSTRLTGLSQGTYLIMATNDRLASDVVTASTVNSSTEVKVVLHPTAAITGRVTGNAPAATRGLTRGGVILTGGWTGVNVRLSRVSAEISQEIDVPLAVDGSFTIYGVGPGSYDVSIQPLPDRSYVRAIRYGPFDALYAPINVNNASPVNQLNIEVAQSNATAQGVVVDRAGRPAPGAEVVLVPRGNRRRADRYLTTIADAGGSFRIAGIPAMDYAILAFEDIGPQEYFVFAYDDNAFNRYTATAQKLSPGVSNTELRLVAIPAEETAGGLR